jgi:nascent polypeptide-associated complex subunit alpha
MGFRGPSPKQMARMMKKMGIEQKDVEGVKEVIIRFADKEWLISNAQVTMIKQAGSESFQITGIKTEQGISERAESKSEKTPEVVKKVEIPMEDAALVASQTGVDIQVAKKALEETGGDLAAAILKLRH